MLIIGVAGAVGSGLQFARDSKLQQSGPRAAGLVLKKTLLQAGDGDSDHVITYRFVGPAGQVLVAQRGVSRSLWSSVSAGSPISIVYAKHDPQHNFPEGTRGTSLGLAMFISAIFGTLAVLGGAVLFQQLRPSRPAQPSKGPD